MSPERPSRTNTEAPYTTELLKLSYDLQKDIDIKYFPAKYFVECSS